MNKKYQVTFLLDKSNLWFKKYIKAYNFKLKKYNFTITQNPKIIKKQDIVFPLNYTKILSGDFLKKNKLTLIIHSSKLPQDKGFAPAQHQILKNKKKIYISLMGAVKKVDSGPIYMQDYFILNGTELYDEIRSKQALAIIKMIKKILLKYPKLKKIKQNGNGNFNRRRHPKDSELNINKSIKSQFNHMRINDNELYPSFFKYKNYKYILKIYKRNK